MKAKVLLTVLACVLLAGCSLRGKPANSAVPPVAPKPAVTPAPAAPSSPLSILQTRIELPKPQPVDPAALATEPAPPELPEPPPPVAPVRPRRGNPAAAQPAAPSPAAVAPPPEPRETFQEIVSPGESKRLLDLAAARRREANQILDQVGRRLNSAEQNVAASIRDFIALSDQAEKRNDLRQAVSLAERAQILAKELQSGK
jgi:hypothetical protein